MKQIVSLLLIFSLVTPLQGHSEEVCPKPVTLLDKGSPAPCKGFLFSPAEEERVYKLSEENKILEEQLTLKDRYIDTYKKDSDNYQIIIDKEKQKAELWRKQAEDSTQKLVEIQGTTGRRDFFLILLGVGLTIGAGYAIGAAAHR